MVGAPDPLDDAYQFLAVVIIGVGIIDDGIGALGRQQDVVFLPADIRRCWEKGDLLMQTLLQRLSQMSCAVSAFLHPGLQLLLVLQLRLKGLLAQHHVLQLIL